MTEVKQEFRDHRPPAGRLDTEVIELLSDTEDEEEDLSQVIYWQMFVSRVGGVRLRSANLLQNPRMKTCL